MLIRKAGRPGAPDRCAIAVMAKASSPGRTKTRLSPPLSLEQAAELNTAFLGDIAENVAVAAAHADIASYMAFGPPGSASFFEKHMPAEVGLLEAWLPNFGDCLRHTLKTLLELGYGAAVVLNADSPTLPTSLLVEAVHRLQQPGDRLVLGPCTDGGYYLLGLKRLHPALFADIAWSTERVLTQTLERAAELRLDTALLPAWYDVDDAASLQRVMRETLEGAQFSDLLPAYAAVRTADFVRRALRQGTLSLPAASTAAAPPAGSGAAAAPVHGAAAASST